MLSPQSVDENFLFGSLILGAQKFNSTLKLGDGRSSMCNHRNLGKMHTQLRFTHGNKGIVNNRSIEVHKSLKNIWTLTRLEVSQGAVEVILNFIKLGHLPLTVLSHFLHSGLLIHDAFSLVIALLAFFFLF